MNNYMNAQPVPRLNACHPLGISYPVVGLPFNGSVSVFRGPDLVVLARESSQSVGSYISLFSTNHFRFTSSNNNRVADL